MPTARQLEIFVAVASMGSMRRAADLLGISQPSISKQLKALERAVRGELLIRSRGERARLSPLGNALLEDAHRMLALQNRFVGHRDDWEAAAGPRIFVRQFMLENIRRRLDELYAHGLPASTAFAVLDDSEDALSRVESSPGTFALLRVASFMLPPSLSAVTLRSDSCSIYVSPNVAERFARGEIRLNEIPILVPGAHRQLTQLILSRADVENPVLQLGSQFIDKLIDEVAEGCGGAILLDWHAEPQVRKQRLEALPLPLGMLHVMLVWGPGAETRVRAQLLDVFQGFYSRSDEGAGV